MAQLNADRARTSTVAELVAAMTAARERPCPPADPRRHAETVRRIKVWYATVKAYGEAMARANRCGPGRRMRPGAPRARRSRTACRTSSSGGGDPPDDEPAEGGGRVRDHLGILARKLRGGD